MNRYIILFLMLVGLQANNVFASNPPKSPSERYPEETKFVFDEFARIIDSLKGNQEEATNLKNACNPHLRNFINNLPYIHKFYNGHYIYPFNKIHNTIVETEGAKCAIEFKVAKVLIKHKPKNDYERDILANRTRKKAYSHWNENQNLSYLIKDSSDQDIQDTQDILNLTEKLCQQRLEFDRQETAKINNVALKSFENLFDIVVDIENLGSFKQNAITLKEECKNYISTILKGLPYLTVDEKIEKARDEGIMFICGYASLAGRHNYIMEHTTRSIDNSEEAYAIRASTDVNRNFYAQTPKLGSLSYLFNKHEDINKKLIEKTKKHLYKRLGIDLE